MAPASAPSTNVGGMQRAARELLTQLLQRPDLEVDELVLACASHELWYRSSFFFLLLPWHLLKRVWLGQVEIILFASLYPAILLPLVAPLLSRRRLRFMAICHGLDVIEGPPIWHHLLGRGLHQLDGVICVSEATAEQCRLRDYPAERIEVLPNGIGPRQPPQQANQLAWPTRTAENFVCLTVGRLIPRKGFAWLVDAVMPLLSAHIQLWMVGGGPQSGQIAQAIARHGLQDRVFQLGVVADSVLDGIYREADLFLMPNLRIEQDMEGFGIVMLEAARSGLFTLASEIEGIRDVITPANGRLLPSKDAWAFANAIQDQAALTPLQRCELGLQAKAWVEQRFGWPMLVPRYISAIRGVQAQPPIRCR